MKKNNEAKEYTVGNIYSLLKHETQRTQLEFVIVERCSRQGKIFPTTVL